MSDTLAVINYIRKLEARIAALERQEGGGGGSGVGLNDSEGDPANVTSAAADGTSTYAARRDHAHTIAAGTVTAAMMQDGAALAEILDDDGTGSGLDADLLDGQHGSYYQAASGYTAADVLTKLLTVDGASSGVDADLLDGQHASAFVEVDGGNYMTGALGIGAASPSPYSLTVRNTDETYVRLDTTATDKGVQLRFHDNTNTLRGRLLFAGGNAAPNKYFGFVNDAGDFLAFFSSAGIQFWGSSAHTYVDGSGNWGFGVSSPQGRMHTSDGTGRTLIGSKTSITGTAQTIVPNGTGDVTKLLRYEIICSDGTNHNSAVGSLAISGTADVACGSNTYQLRVNADGSVDIRRTAGSTNGTATYRLLWL